MTVAPRVPRGRLARAAWAVFDRVWRPRVSAPRQRPLTALDCTKILRRHGWADGGAGPNHVCTYLSKGTYRITVLTLHGDLVTPIGLRALIEDVRGAAFTAGRRCVAVYQRAVSDDAVALAAPHDITLIHVDRLAWLDQALDAATVAAARSRTVEYNALMKVYDPPVAAPMRIAATREGPAPLLETESVAVFMRDRGGDDLLITFANQWLRYDGRAFWGDSLSKALDMSVVGFVPKEPNWFPPDDMTALLPAVLDILGGRFSRRVCYGHSQGGYGAIKFSASLGAETVLAFSPQYAIDARIVADERVNKYYAGRLHAGMAITAADTAGTILLFYDRADLADATHAARIGDAIACHSVPIPFVGHASDRGMNNAAHVAGLLRAARTGGAAAVRRFVAQNRAVRADRAVLMAHRLAAAKPRLASAILDKHGVRWTTNQISGVCYRLAMAGAADLAFEPARRAAEAAPANANAQGSAGLIALTQRRPLVALPLIERAVALEPHSAKWRNALQRAHSLAMAESVALASQNGQPRPLF